MAAIPLSLPHRIIGGYLAPLIVAVVIAECFAAGIGYAPSWVGCLAAILWATNDYRRGPRAPRRLSASRAASSESRPRLLLPSSDSPPTGSGFRRAGLWRADPALTSPSARPATPVSPAAATR